MIALMDLLSMVTENHFFYSFGLDQPPGHKIYKKPRVKLFKEIQPFLSHFTFYLEDNDHKPIDFNGEITSFTCQIIKI